MDISRLLLPGLIFHSNPEKHRTVSLLLGMLFCGWKKRLKLIEKILFKSFEFSFIGKLVLNELCKLNLEMWADGTHELKV